MNDKGWGEAIRLLGTEIVPKTYRSRETVQAHFYAHVSEQIPVVEWLNGVRWTGTEVVCDLNAFPDDDGQGIIDLLVTTWNGVENRTICPGRWIVKEDHDIYIYTPDEFKEKYEVPDE